MNLPTVFDSSAVAAIFRLDTTYGGSKTHGLIAVTHADLESPQLWPPGSMVFPEPEAEAAPAAFSMESLKALLENDALNRLERNSGPTLVRGAPPK